jgi:hypothetical protein
MIRPHRSWRLEAWCAVALGALLACSTGTPYAQAVAQFPAIPPGYGRLLVYLPTSSEAPAFHPDIAIDGKEVGKIATGTFIHVDLPVGMHEVGIFADEHLAGFGNQGATDPVTIEVLSGSTSYVQVGVLVTVGMVKVVLLPEPAADAQRDLSNLYLTVPVPQ